MNIKPNCLKKAESLPVELGLVTLHDARLRPRNLESTLNEEVSFNKTVILDQENSHFIPSCADTSTPQSPPLPQNTTPPPIAALVHHRLTPLTACNNASKANVVSVGTQTNTSQSCTIETGAVSLQCSPAASVAVAHDQLNITNDSSPPLSPHFI